MKRFVALGCLLAVFLGVWLSGCSSISSTSLSDHLVAPGGVSPLLDRERIAAAIARLPNRSGHTTGRAGVPVFWRVIDAGDYRIDYRYDGGDDAHSLDMAFDFRVPAGFRARPPRGTVVLLHGWMMDGDSLLPWSLTLARAGYRVVTIDLRNHGHSGSGPAGYGTRESDDVLDVIADLRRRGEIGGALHLFGVSYGAATALLAAGKLGDEVASVVAMESFANAGRGIRDMVPHMLSLQPAGWRGQTAARYARWRYGGQALDAAIADAGRRLDLDLDHVDVGEAASHASACILLLHGDADRHIPVAHGRRLAQSAPQVRYVELQGEDHLSLPMRLDLLGDMVVDWMAHPLAGSSSCGSPLLPADGGHRFARLPSPHADGPQG